MANEEIKTATDLRKRLCKVFNDLEIGAVDFKTASEMNNTAGKILGTVKVQLESAKLRDEKPEIEFTPNN
jgi:hypothetical protein